MLQGTQSYRNGKKKTEHKRWRAQFHFTSHNFVDIYCFLQRSTSIDSIGNLNVLFKNNICHSYLQFFFSVFRLKKQMTSHTLTAVEVNKIVMSFNQSNSWMLNKLLGISRIHCPKSSPSSNNLSAGLHDLLTW